MNALLLALFTMLPAFSAPAKVEPQKPNILILSIDSLRRFPGEPYNIAEKDAPNLVAFAKKSYFYKNFFSLFCWQNIVYWISRMPSGLFDRSGYEPIGLSWNPGVLRKIDALKMERIPPKFYLLSEHGYFDFALKLLKQRLNKPRTKPFFLEVHFKEIHPPMYMAGVTTLEKLTPKSARLLKSYLTNPERFPDKVVLFSFLFDPMLRLSHDWRTDAALDRLIEEKRIHAGWALLPTVDFQSSDKFLNLWKNSKNYTDDIELMKELFSLKLRELDQKIGEVLELYDNEELKKNTLLMVVGNFGFSFMEHGKLFNSEDTYDEFNGTSMMVRFPGQNSGRVLEEQASLRGATKFLETVIQNGLSGGKEEDLLRSTAPDPNILVRNYNRNILDRKSTRLNSSH